MGLTSIEELKKKIEALKRKKGEHDGQD